MSTAYNRNEVDIQSSLQSVRHNMIAKDMTEDKTAADSLRYYKSTRYTNRFEGSANQS
ncbi:MAG: hypothetical protein WAZ77_22500 [Candidatus Nitrosopolaris sp.]|jgi:hypothetical protein